MKLKDIIQNLDMSEQNQAPDVDIQRVALALGLGYADGWHDFQERVKKYWVSSWMCTDTRVGLAVYVMDGEPVAISGQVARKSDEHFEFFSVEAGIKMRNFILSLQEYWPFEVSDMDTEIDGEWFTRAGT